MSIVPTQNKQGFSHKVDRLLGFFSNRPNGVPPPPHSQVSVSLHFVPGGGGAFSLAGEGMGRSQFGGGDRYGGTLGIYVLCGFSCRIGSNQWEAAMQLQALQQHRFYKTLIGQFYGF